MIAGFLDGGIRLMLIKSSTHQLGITGGHSGCGQGAGKEFELWEALVGGHSMLQQAWENATQNRVGGQVDWPGGFRADGHIAAAHAAQLAESLLAQEVREYGQRMEDALSPGA